MSTRTEETIFHAARAIIDPVRRAEYVRDACEGNDDLLRQVEALLAAHDNPNSFLHEPYFGPGADADTTRTGPGAEFDIPLNFLTPSTTPGSLGRLGHYEVQEVVGRGGFGIVLRAFDEKLHRVVAIKVMAPQLAASAGGRKRFAREAQAAAAVRDDHVVGIYAVEEVAGVLYLVMEYIAGPSLQHELD
jgi:serine/threonine protein kinase